MKHLVNSTLSRKPGHDMKKNVGAPQARTRADQSGDGEDFAFNGQMGDGVNRSKGSERYNSNPAGVTMRENFGQGPRTGVKAGTGKTTSVVATAAGGKINGGASAECPTNADKIYMGLGPGKGNE